MSAEMVKATLNGEHIIILPKHRADRPEWYTPEGWEKARLKRLHEVITDQQIDKANSVIYYVGAEEGEMCALSAIWGAKVIMFEPNEKVMPNMRAIWEANGLPMTDRFYAGFAGNEIKGNQELVAIEQITGEVIHDHGFKELQDAGDIPITTIDAIAEKTGDIPTIITMDVEGAEFEVLKGAEQTIRKHKPDIFLSLHPEFLIQYWGVYSYDVRRWIIDLGYKEELLDYQHEVHLHYTPTEG